MKKINNWIIRTFGLRGSWSWAKNLWSDINITDNYRSLKIDANKLFDHGILSEGYDKLRVINIGQQGRR